MSCVVACNMDQYHQDVTTDPCDSILISDESGEVACKAGDIKKCALILDENSTALKNRVAFNSDVYEVKPSQYTIYLFAKYAFNHRCA